MFQLTHDEMRRSRSQSVTLNGQAIGTTKVSPRQSDDFRRGQDAKYGAYAFTEQGVAMLSSVLRSPRAIQVNIEIMRAFVRLRGLVQGDADLAAKVSELEQEYDGQFRVVFDAIRELMKPDESDREPIGFRP